MVLREASTTDPGATFTLLCATIQRLKMAVPMENACLEGVKVHKTYLRQPRPRDTAAATQTGGTAGDASAMRATPTGTAHGGLKGKANPRHRHAARQKQMGAVGGGEGPVGASVAQDGAQQQTSTTSSQGEHNRAGYTQRRAHKVQSLKGGDKRDTDDLVGDTVAVNTDRNRLPAHSQSSTAGVSSRYAAAARKSVESERVAGSGCDSRESRQSDVGGVPSVAIAGQGAAAECQSSTAGVNSRYAAAARKSVESERVAGSGGISHDVSRKLGVGGVLSVAAQGAVAECQGSVTAVRRDYAAAANKSGPKAKDAEIARLQREIERLQRDTAKLQRSERDLKQRPHEEKKIADGMFGVKLTIKLLGSVQQSAQHRKQQPHVAHVLQKRAAAARVVQAMLCGYATRKVAARAAEKTAATKIAEQAAAAKAEEATAADVAEDAATARAAEETAATKVAERAATKIAEDKSAALRAAIRQHQEQQRAAAEEASKAAADKGTAGLHDLQMLYDMDIM